MKKTTKIGESLMATIKGLVNRGSIGVVSHSNTAIAPFFNKTDVCNTFLKYQDWPTLNEFVAVYRGYENLNAEKTFWSHLEKEFQAIHQSGLSEQNCIKNVTTLASTIAYFYVLYLRPGINPHPANQKKSFCFLRF